MFNGKRPKINKKEARGGKGGQGGPFQKNW